MADGDFHSSKVSGMLVTKRDIFYLVFFHSSSYRFHGKHMSVGSKTYVEKGKKALEIFCKLKMLLKLFQEFVFNSLRRKKKRRIFPLLNFKSFRSNRVARPLMTVANEIIIFGNLVSSDDKLHETLPS